MPFARPFQTLWAAVVGWMEAVLSRGRKKPSLRDLSHIHDLDPHIQDMLHELDHQTDRGAALIASAMIDVTLTRAMLCRMVGIKDIMENMFQKDGAPLGTFSARIKTARAFGVIGPFTESHLDSIRRIRNQFAHSPLKIDFTNELIAAEIDKLAPDSPGWKPDWTPQRRRYIGTAVLIGQALENVVAEKMPTEWIDVWTA